jgi:predicted dehydrogenase
MAPGKIAHKFAADLLLFRKGALLSVAGRDVGRTQSFAEKFALSSCYGNFVEMLEKEHLDVVYIAAPHSLHFEMAKLCLENDVSVLCEKPVTINAAQLNALVSLAERKGLFFMEALWSLFLPSIQCLLKMIQDGEIGNVTGVKADFGFRVPEDESSRLFDPNLGGGSLLDIGIYPLLLATVCLGQPEEIKALASITNKNIDDELMAVLKYKNKGLAQIHASFRANTRTEAFIYGERGTIWIPNRWIDSRSYYLIRENGRVELFHKPWEGYGYQFQAMEVEKCLSEGKQQSEIAPLHVSLQLMNMMDAIRKQTGVVYPEDQMSF